MVKVIPLNPNPHSKNFILDKIGNRVDRINDPQASRIVFQNFYNSPTIIDITALKEQYGGLYYTERKEKGDENVVYYFDDGYYNKLLTCGYFVANNYDRMKCENRDLGIKINNRIYNLILKSITESNKTIDDSTKSVKIYWRDDKYLYTVVFMTTTDLSGRNIKRKLNNLPYYPFDSEMDKYGTYFVAGFAKLFPDVSYDDRDASAAERQLSDKIASMIASANTMSIDSDIYHYEPIKVNRIVIYSEGTGL